MNKTQFVELVNKKARLIKVKAGKHAPEILTIAGIGGFVISTVLACKATSKLSPILEDSKEDIANIRAYREKNPDDKATSGKALVVAYAKAGAKAGKLYAPAIAVGTFSAMSILAANDILKKRNVAVSAALATVTQDFKDYRRRVVEKYGEEIDRKLRHGIETREVEETVVDDKGKEKKVKKTIEVAEGLEGYSEYAKFFDESSRNWEKDSEYNLMFLRAQQAAANDKLRANGYLFLNDVYDMLDIPRTRAGQVVGWVYRPDDPDHKGDDFVDFGIYEVNCPAVRDFVNGYERVILLDFNVEGDILKYI